MKLYLRTFGCRANQYDSEQVRALAERAGHEIVAAPDDADVAVYNSCAVTAAAEAELRREVRRGARANPSLRSVVMGCASVRDAGAIAALPGVSDVIAGAEYPEIARALGIEPDARSFAATQSGTRALLRVQDGCDEHCTFCATTLARGASRSRLAAELVEEAQGLAARHAEIVITGVHIGTYEAADAPSLGALVERLVRDVPGVRFRLTSVEATEVDERLADLLTGDPGRVAPHLHAPLQSGSDAVLRRMGRHWYSAERYGAAVERLAMRASVFALGADVITGFPGETEADHRATVQLVERLPFTYLHVFPYSPRPGTAATRLGHAVAPAEAAERAAELRAAADRKAAAWRLQRAGGDAEVIVIGGAARREGLTEDYLTVRPADASLPRGARFRGRLAMDGDALVALPA